MMVNMDSSISINWRQILIGFITLIFGILIYLTARPPDSAYFLKLFGINFYKFIPNIFGKANYNLPSFFHVFSFILITAGLIATNRKGFIAVCLGWFFIDFLFELGQLYNSFIPSLIPDWFDGVFILENTQNYFIQGTFDFYDLFALANGSLIAYFVLMGTKRRRCSE
jgi:hypothetical protein